MPSQDIFLIIEARFYEDLADALAAGAIRALEAAGVRYERLEVPGALEIPAAIAMASQADQGQRYAGFVALGCVIRGETYHFEVVSNESSQALQALAISDLLAIGNGILTVENRDQAWVRADPGQKDKGGDAARAALAMAAIARRYNVDNHR